MKSKKEKKKFCAQNIFSTTCKSTKIKKKPGSYFHHLKFTQNKEHHNFY